MYRAVAAGFVLDSRDKEMSAEVSEMGFRTWVFDTVMTDGGGALAGAILEALT
jgi:hypothetical protein